MRKPFDVLTEGLVSETSGEDKTPIELFIAGVRGWDAGIHQFPGEIGGPSVSGLT
jgi:hypothetical protein